MKYEIYFTKQALKDMEKIKQAGLDKKVNELLDIIQQNPYQIPPAYEKLVGNLSGLYSRRINIQHRLVYSVERNIIKIACLWTHYQHI